jgi:hypothetical protein
MNTVRALVLAIAAAAVAIPTDGMAMPFAGTASIVEAQTAAQTMLDQVQYRRPNGPQAVRGPVRGGPVRGPVRRRGGGGGGGAAAAIIGLGVLGAIAAGSAASARPAECWYERQRVVDDWGRPMGVRRVRVCR